MYFLKKRTFYKLIEKEKYKSVNNNNDFHWKVEQAREEFSKPEVEQSYKKVITFLFRFSYYDSAEINS